LVRQEVILSATAKMRRRVLVDQRWSTVTLYVGVVIVGLLAIGAVFAPLITSWSPTEIDLSATLQPPSLDHIMGTDEVGRDIFSRVLYGLRIDLWVVLVVTYVPAVIGVTIGAIAGYVGGWADAVVGRSIDIVMAFPFIVLVIAIVAITGPGLKGVLIGVTIVGWALYARLTRGEMLALREQQFMLAGKALGYSRLRIIARHGIPNLIRSNLVFSMADVVLNLLLLASLSFLGLGVQPPTPELGAIIADGQPYLLTAWWITTLPGIVLVTLGAGFSLIGDGLADRMGKEFRLAV
jgi:peptide/nickel transport system permease protein